MWIIEAASAGNVCVAAKIGGIPDAVEDGKSGFLTETGNYEEIANVIVDLLENQGKMRTMSQYAKERAKKEFDWEVIIRKYEDLFGKLLQQ